MKWLITTLSIAVGVGLGLAVHLIHQEALAQFNQGVQQFSGQADVQLLPHNQWLPDTLLETIAELPEVHTAAPVIDQRVRLEGLNQTVRWLGLDVFQSAAITPNLVGQVDSSAAAPTRGEIPLIASNTVFISASLREALHQQAHAQKSQRSPVVLADMNGKPVRWMIAGSLPAAGSGQLLAMSDIAALQWKLGAIGKISRVDIKLQEGVRVDAFMAAHAKTFSAVGRFETPREQSTRGAAVSQAYRANLSILAMVALLTGGFLSFSTQMLAVAQRSRQWALLAAMGTSVTRLRLQVLFESAVCGLVGSILGVALGVGLAQGVVEKLGVDLGAGYFNTASHALTVQPLDALLFMGFGLLATLLGGLAPSQHTAQMAIAQRMRAGTEEAGLRFANRAHWLGLALCALAVACLWIPPVGNIPVGGYLAVALGLFGGIALLGLAVRLFVRPPEALHTLGQLARSRLASTPNLLSVGLSGVVASFALVVAMHVMIFSFRQSLDVWLNQVLPAPLYMKVIDVQSQSISPNLQTLIQHAAGVERAEFWGSQSMVLDPLRPPVELIVRPLDMTQADQRLPLIGAQHPALKTDHIPVWVSEPMVDIYRLHNGSTFTLHLDGGLQLNAQVMGVWRDYSRQHGAIVVPKAQVMRLATQNNNPLRDTQGAIWPSAGTTPQTIVKNLTAQLVNTGESARYTFAEPGEIRQASLAIFDRSFAVTYLLEVAAVVIGLFGVGTTFSAMALQRRREFALLGAMGATRKLLVRLLVREALLSSALAAGMGLAIGLSFAAILVFVVNPQSFHWTMEWFTPWRDLLVMVAVLMVMSTLTVTLALRSHLQHQLLMQLKEDWS
ncbi:ABC transporter permease [Limnobacter humi]|uniref:ABC transporter permease n=1 Tax=Limnobacter humi TaxID=1778671 RepID=A0ABT1WHX5_9BURK|nr:ABC transporter permease [Limnobacter humi]